MRGIVRRCDRARVDIVIRSAASGTAFSTDDLHAHVRHRHRCAATDQRLAPEAEGKRLRLEGLFSIWGLSSHYSIRKNAAGYPQWRKRRMLGDWE